MLNVGDAIFCCVLELVSLVPASWEKKETVCEGEIFCAEVSE